MDMNKEVLVQYERGFLLFEQQQYDEAVKCFIEVYESRLYREEVLDVLYQGFILPNQEEFRKNYYENNQGLSRVEYDNLPIDFIPVTDTKFYLFDTEEKRFLGSMELTPPQEDRDFEFDSLLIADRWDFREIFVVMNEKRWSMIYIIPGEHEKRFMSFCKLPGFSNMYLQNVLLFPDAEIMRLYFDTYPEFYLPQMICSKDDDKYIQILKDIHLKRIQNKEQERKNIFLSICIPSYNRGACALENVRHILELPYDAEIEVVLSNNGSDKERDEYSEIGKLNDSRVSYFAFESNQGYATNVRKVLELAKGKFAVIVSDEDFLIPEFLGEYLNDLINHVQFSLIFSRANHNSTAQKKKDYEEERTIFEQVINWNYVTGLTFNMTYFNNHKVLERFDLSRGNEFLEFYAHIALALMTCDGKPVHNSGLMLWAKAVSDSPADKKEHDALNYMQLASRINQQNSCIQLLKNAVKMSDDAFKTFLSERMAKTYFLLGLACKTFKKFHEENDWIDTCIILHENNRTLIESRETGLLPDEISKMKSAAAKIFCTYLDRHPGLERVSAEDRVTYRIFTDLVRYMIETGREVSRDTLSESREKVSQFTDSFR